MNIDKLIIDSIETVLGVNKTTGELMLMLDQLKDGSLECAHDTVWMTGRQGVQLAGFDRNKTSTFSCNNAYVVTGALAAQIGSEVVEASEGDALVVPDYFERITVSSNTATLEFTPVGTTGAEVPFVWRVNSDGSQGEKLEAAVSATTGKFKVDAKSKTLTFADGDFEDGAEIYVLYDYEVVSGRKIINSGEKFSTTCRLIIDLVLRDSCDTSIRYHGKLVFPNAKIDGNFSISIGDEPAVHAFSAQAMVDFCSKDKTLWDLYVVE